MGGEALRHLPVEAAAIGLHHHRAGAAFPGGLEDLREAGVEERLPSGDDEPRLLPLPSSTAIFRKRTGSMSVPPDSPAAGGSKGDAVLHRSVIFTLTSWGTGPARTPGAAPASGGGLPEVIGGAIAPGAPAGGSIHSARRPRPRRDSP